MGDRHQYWDIIILSLLLIGILWARMDLSTSTPTLSYDSYLTVRDVDHIQQTHTPLRTDPLSITGNKRLSPPVYDYLLAGIVLLTPLMYKLLPNLLMVLCLLPIFFMARRVTTSPTLALAAVILAGTGPIVFASYLITPTSEPLGILLLLLILSMVYNPDKYLYPILVCMAILTFVSPLIFILVIALLSMIVLLRIEDFGVDRRVNEMFFFTLLLALWFYIIIYRQALFTEGLNVLWQNLPSTIANLSFRNVTFLDVINGLGTVTFLLGAIGLYNALFETKNRSPYAIIGGIIAIILALLARVITIQLGLLVLTLLGSIMAAYGLMVSINYLELTKAPWLKYPFIIFLLSLFIVSGVLPALVDAKTTLQNSPSAADITTYEALHTIIPPNAIILTTIKEGAVVQYYTDRTTLTDNDFLLVKNGNELTNDIDAVYTSPFSATVLDRAQKLGFTDILFSNIAATQYNRLNLSSAGTCVQGTPVGNAIIYHVACQEVTS